MRRSVGVLLLLVACEPELTVSRFDVERAPVESCVQVQGQVEQCQEPAAVVDRIPVVLELGADNSAVLFAGDPGSGSDRAYTGNARGGVIQLGREQRSDEPGGGCSLLERSDLSLTVDGVDLNGSERRVVVESAACTTAGLDKISRSDWRWSGTRVDAE